MSDKRDFHLLDETRARHGVSHAIGATFAWARDHVARFMIRIGATPNRLTFLGFLLTVGAGACLVLGAGHRVPWDAPPVSRMPVSVWPFIAMVCVFLASACDMLDGAVARVGGLGSPFGGILDSTLDRFSDIAVYLGCAVHFAMIGNVTYVTLAVVAMCNSYMISYIKARAETEIDNCTIGYWARGERSVGLLICTCLGHMPVLLWQQAVLPFCTFMSRLLYARSALAARAQGRPEPPRGPRADALRYLTPWRFPRGSVPYDFVSGFNIAFLIAAPWVHPFFYGDGDPLRRLLAPWIAT